MVDPPSKIPDPSVEVLFSMSLLQDKQLGAIDTVHYDNFHQAGGLAHMVERSLSMREVPGSMPGSSTF